MNAPTARGLLTRRAAAHQAALEAFVATALEAIPALVQAEVPDAIGLVWSRSWDDYYKTERIIAPIAALMDDGSNRPISDALKTELVELLRVMVWFHDPANESKRNGVREWAFEPRDDLDQGFVV